MSVKTRHLHTQGSIYDGWGHCVMNPYLTRPLNKIIKIRQVTEVCQALLMVSVAYGQGRIQRGRMRGMHPPFSHFQTCV